MKQVNIGVGYRLAVLVDDGACQMAVCLVGTLHEYLMLPAFDNSNGVETDYLEDGIRQRFLLNICPDLKILQLLVDEVDGVVPLQVVEFHQCLRH